MTKVLFVDDHAAIRESLSYMMERESDMEVVQACDLAQARALLEGIDVLLVDARLPDGHGTELIGEYTKANPLGRTIVLTGSQERVDLARAVNAGAASVLYKLSGAGEIIRTVRQAASGELILPSEDLRRLASTYGADETQSLGKLEKLTPRERDVLQRAADGLDDNQISGELGLSVNTVRVHLTSIFRKLDVQSRTQAVLLALRYGAVRLYR